MLVNHDDVKEIDISYQWIAIVNRIHNDRLHQIVNYFS